MNDINIKYRLFNKDDHEEIARIQKANLISNLSDAEKVNGFLSAGFLPQELEEINAEIPIVVADLGSGLGGYVFGTTIEQSLKFPLLAHIISLFKENSFNGRPINEYKVVFYGPICVDEPLRGRGVVQGLFKEYLKQLAPTYEVCISFVSSYNPRSMRAHLNKLGMTKVCEFSFEGKQFNMLGFEIKG